MISSISLFRKYRGVSDNLYLCECFYKTRNTNCIIYTKVGVIQQNDSTLSELTEYFDQLNIGDMNAIALHMNICDNPSLMLFNSLL